MTNRFFSKVEVTDTCWLWKAGTSSSTGYGNFWYEGKTISAHRFIWTQLYGEPENQLDHLCSTRRCVNPEHLEDVTSRENLLRSELTQANINKKKTHCPRGHEYTEENTRHRRGSRECRACGRENYTPEKEIDFVFSEA